MNDPQSVQEVTKVKDGSSCSKVKFLTLGCRLNQYETQAIREQFLQARYSETHDAKETDIFVLNTCTVTRDSDRTSRYLIRKFHRENPEAKIIVTGCYVERNRKEVQSLPGVTMILGNQEKSEIVRLLESCASFSSFQEHPFSRRRFVPLSISHFEGRTRAYIKIQDGCNHACSFCKVVLVRGPARSRPMEDVISEAKRLSDNGHQEVVLTGIQLGAYGFDFGKQQMLGELLSQLSCVSGLKRIRLSSIEPTDVTDKLLDAMASIENVCHHLHIPLQSGSDEVLKRMNRRYGLDFYRRLIQKIRARVDDFVLTTDVMVGFPGETDDQFNETLDLLVEIMPYKLHIFPYSAREGTRAARFEDTVSATVMHHRRKVLSLLEEKLRRNVQERFLGRSLQVLVEDAQEEGWQYGRAANYVMVRFQKEDAQAGSFQNVLLERISGFDLIGGVISKEERR